MKSKLVLLLTIVCLSIVAAKAQPPKLCNIKGVLVERTEPEISSQVSQSTIEKLRYDPNYFNPMGRITVEAKRNDNETVVSTNTDKEGNYVFNNLADGIYVVSPVLSKDYEKAIYYATVVSKDCIESSDIFEIHTIGNLKGRIENLPRYSPSPQVVLSPTGSEKIYAYHQNRLYIRDLLNSSKICKTIRTIPNAIEFDCVGLPTGKYYLDISWRESGFNPIYYPGVGSLEAMTGRKPEIIEIKKAQTTDASFKLPYRN